MAQTDCRHFPTKGEMGICKMALRSILTLPTENISYPIPSDEDLWIRFLRHGVIAPHLPESQYPTLYGVFLEGEVVPLKELWERPKDFELPHCLLLDREKRELYLCRTDHTTLLFALTEPEDEDHHSVYIDDHLMNSESENYKVPPREELRAEVLEWLDLQFEIARGRATAACEMIVDKRA